MDVQKVTHDCTIVVNAIRTKYIINRGIKFGWIATMSISGSVNTEVFVTYVAEVLVPQLWIGAIVIMDNLSVHTAAVVAKEIESVGARLVFCPLIHRIYLRLNYAGQN